MRWGGGWGSVHQAGNWSGGPDGAVRLPTSVQTILYPELSAVEPLGDRHMSENNTGVTEVSTAGEGLRGPRPSSTPQTQDKPASSSEPGVLPLGATPYLPHGTPNPLLSPGPVLSAQHSPHT